MALCAPLIQIGCCCAKGAQKAMDDMTTVDRLGNEAMGSAQRCMDIGQTLAGAVQGKGKGFSPDPMQLMKIIPLFTDAKGFCDSMVGMAEEVVTDAVQMVEACNSAMDNCITGTCKACGCAAGDGSDADDPPPADKSGDIDELEALKNAFLGGNLMGMVTSGAAAMDGIEGKVGIIGELCKVIIDFAVACVKITSALISGNLAAIPAQVGKFFRCIRLSDMMKQFAEELMRLVNIFADLFKAMIDKIESFNPLKAAGAAMDMAGDAAGALGDMVGAPSAMGAMGKMF